MRRQFSICCWFVKIFFFSSSSVGRGFGWILHDLLVLFWSIQMENFQKIRKSNFPGCHFHNSSHCLPEPNSNFSIQISSWLDENLNKFCVFCFKQILNCFMKLLNKIFKLWALFGLSLKLGDRITFILSPSTGED